VHRQYFTITGFVPESPILSNLQYFRLLGNWFVPVTIESVTICDICDQNVIKPVLLKKLKKREEQIRSQIQICDNLRPSQNSQIGHTFGAHDWYKPVSVSVCKSGLEWL